MKSITILEIPPDRLKQMHLLQLDILKEFDRICRKHGLKYTLAGGSMLGAVRHEGFIPWDDDIDVSMLREDYDKFCEICKQELDLHKYFLQTMDTDPEYRLTYGRILLNGTAYVRAGQEHKKCRNGIFIDIFPRDGKSDNCILAFIQRKLAFLMRKTLYSPVGKLRSKNGLARILFSILSELPREFSVALQSIIQLLNCGKNTKRVECYGLMENEERKKIDMGCQVYREYKKRLRYESIEDKKARKDRDKGFKREYFEKVTDMSFEGVQVMVSEYYDIWLKTNYDDYMSLPPEEKRQIHQTVSYYSFGPYEDVDLC